MTAGGGVVVEVEFRAQGARRTRRTGRFVEKDKHIKGGSEGKY